MHISARNRISLRLAYLSVGIALVLGLVLNLAQLAIDFTRQDEAINDIVEQIITVAARPASDAVFDLNVNAAEGIVAGLLEYDFIVQAQINDEFGGLLISKRSVIEKVSQLRKLVNFLTSEFSTHTRQLSYGTLQVVVDRYAALNDFIDRFILVLLSGMIRNVLLAAILVWFFHRLLGQPLTRLSDELASMDPDHPSKLRVSVDEQHKDDELGHLAAYINHYADANDRSREQQQEAETKARASEERFKQIAEASEDVFVISEMTTGAVLYANPAYERIWGRPVQQLYEDVGQWEEGVFPDDLPRMRVCWARMKETGERYDEQYRVLRPDGSKSWVRSRGYPIHDDNGQMYRTATLIQDITEIKQAHQSLEERESMLADAATLSNLGYATWSEEQHCFLSVSEEYARIYGYCTDELMDRFNTLDKRLNLYHPEDRDQFETSYFAQIKTDGVRHFEYRIIRKDKEVRYIKEWARPVKGSGGKPLHTLLIHQDITDFKRVETELQRHRAQLEDRVEQRTFELQQANESLRSTLEKLKSAQGQLVQAEKLASLGGLVAGVAHEINTPLGVAITATTHLQSKMSRQPADDGGSNMHQLALDLILGNLQRASKLVSSFKLVAADQISGKRRKFNLRDHLNVSLTSLQPIVRKAGHKIELRCDANIEVDGYPSALYQIVSNLVTNSIVHGYGDGLHGHLTLNVSQRDDQMLMIYQDDGKGISDEIAEHIFEPFFTTSRGSGSTGLGMYIVFNLVSQMGGKIAVESHDGDGARFMIELPLIFPTHSSTLVV